MYQKTVDYPEEWANGYHVMLDTVELVTVRWDQVEAEPPAGHFPEPPLHQKVHGVNPLRDTYLDPHAFVNK